MDSIAMSIVLLIISGVLIPAIPTIIITVYVTNRNSKHISTLFARYDQIKDDIHKMETENKLVMTKMEHAIDRLEEIIKEIKRK